jgi:3-hydroxyacyl-[acyl-carrier-protein] dehydratase
MRFRLIDRIVDLQPGAAITAIKSLSLAEEYLKDHFPRFPVMPGVLMLEAMFQASAWLVRASEDFAHTVVMLREARNVKYADFVQPGQTLTVTAQLVKQDSDTTDLKAKGMVEGRVAVSARLILARFNLADRGHAAALDDFARRRFREEFHLLHDPAPALHTVY